MPTITANFSTTAEQERYLSIYGIASFADHDDDGLADPNVLADCVNYATSKIAGLLSQRYTFANMQLATILPEIEVIIALRRLTHRRGNQTPASLEVDFQESIQADGDLDLTIRGKQKLLKADGEPVPEKPGAFPSWANLRIDRRYHSAKIRVTDSSNLDPTSLRRNRSYNYPSYWIA